jgi:DNA-binding SARP family transcriptional activator
MTRASAPAPAPRLRLYLFGKFHLESEAGPIYLPTRKIESLLAYLALHRDEQQRETLAALLWGDSPDVQARNSLRHALATLRKSLGDDLLLADREAVQLNPAFPLWVDALEFQAQATRFLSEPAPDPDSIDVSLYQGDLLAGFYDDWIPAQREYYHGLYVDTLLRLTQNMRSRSEYGRAIKLARQVLATDPGNEKAHQALMFCYTASGDQSAALKQYQECRRSLLERVRHFAP